MASGDRSAEREAQAERLGTTIGRRVDTAMSSEREQKEGKRLRKERKQAEGALTSGLIFSALFGALLVFQGGWFWGFPLVFLGVLPAVKGIMSLRRVGVSQRRQAPAPPDPQTEVLRIARRHHGRVTPALVAIDTALSVAEAEGALNLLVRDGHAAMTVADDGRVEYEFREFLPPAAGSRGR